MRNFSIKTARKAYSDTAVRRTSLEQLSGEVIGDVSRFFKFGEEEMQILNDVDQAAEEIQPVEVESYLKREVNMEVFTILKRHKLSDMPLSQKYGGRDANSLVSALAFERLGQVYVGLGAITSMSLCAKTIED